MKKLLVLLLLILSAAPSYAVRIGGGGLIPGAPTAAKTYDGDWDRTNLTAELLLDNFHLNGSSIDRWYNTGSLGSAGDYIQATTLNQPLVGSATHGAWFTANTTMTKAVIGNEGVGDNVTRYFVFNPNYTGSWKVIANWGGNSQLYFYDTTIRVSNVGGTTVKDLTFTPGILNKTMIIAYRRSTTSTDNAIATALVNGTTYKHNDNSMDGMYTPEDVNNHIFGHATIAPASTWYLYLSYDAYHSNAEVLATMAAINRYLRRARINEATIY